MINTTQRKAIVHTKVRLQNARELRSSLGSVQRSHPIGQIELRYPPLVQSDKPTYMCACCGEGADAVTLVSYVTSEAHQSSRTIHAIPSCSHCKAHQQAPTSGGGGILLLMVVFFLIMFYFIGDIADTRIERFCGALILIAGELPLLLWVGSRIGRNERELESHLGEQCTGLRFCSFKREQMIPFIDKVPVDVFLFTNREYALRFAELNGGKVE
jgi:hypothetical protein